MVRKRSRKYDSDENDSDSDVDFEPAGNSNTAEKKYSLRERKRVPSFSTNFDFFDFDEDLDNNVQDGSSNDEDFALGTDQNIQSPALVDYEDMIRADIVVNRQHKVDYENIIEKSEIKIVQPKKRGRKPKNRRVEQVEEVDHICEPDLENLAQFVSQNKEDAKSEASTLAVNQELRPEKELSVGEPQSISSITDDGSKVETEGIEEEDDDVIVLGEPNQVVIVLDD